MEWSKTRVERFCGGGTSEQKPGESPAFKNREQGTQSGQRINHWSRDWQVGKENAAAGAAAFG
jgi:hypothetical protein